MPISSLDAVRAAYPHLGLALYAMEPRGPVTLEIHMADGTMFTFAGPTEQAVLAKAFPPDMIEPEPAPAEPAVNIFD